MGEEYNEKSVSYQHIIHPAWCAGWQVFSVITFVM
jgi:hypothetical protein